MLVFFNMPTLFQKMLQNVLSVIVIVETSLII